MKTKSTPERAVQNDIRNELAENPALRIYRANVGAGWTGNAIVRASSRLTVELQPGDVVIRQARPFDTGLPEGFPDLVGGVQHTVTEADVGKKLAVLAFIENKSATGKLSEKQAKFLKALSLFGAKTGVARSAEDAKRILFET